MTNKWNDVKRDKFITYDMRIVNMKEVNTKLLKKLIILCASEYER